MYPKIIKVRPLDNYILHLIYDNSEEKYFDIKPFLKTGRFAELQNQSLFRKVNVSFDTVEWPNGIDLDPETLYNHSKNIS
ncbi:MAG: DUF2442 domain-containing protein [Candidatus Kapaibacterium sp.]